MQKLGDYRSTDTRSDQEIVSGIAELTHAESTLAAQKCALLAEFSRRGLNVGLKYSTAGRWLAAGTRVADGNADRQFDVANWLTHWPAISSALRGGDIHLAHVNAVFDGYNHVRECDPTLGSDAIAAVVVELLTVAFDFTAAKVKTRAHELGLAAAQDARTRHENAVREQKRREDEKRERERRQRNDDEPLPLDEDDPDPGPEPEPVPSGPPPLLVSENSALNRLSLYVQANGRTALKGDFDKVLAERLRAALSPLAKPEPGPDGSRDPRSSSQRDADALSRLLDRYATSGLRGTGADRPHVNVVVNLKDLIRHRGNSDSSAESNKSDSSGDDAHPRGDNHSESARPTTPADDPLWPFYLEWTGPISRSLAQLLSCDADLTPIIVDDNGVPLSMGRSIRLATPAQRDAVIVRDRCCVMCGRPARWCQVHHIVFWENGGATDITNLALVCGDCHRRVHQEGWGLVMGEDGHPVVIPPLIEDAERKPRPSYHRRRQPAAS
nr:HNH endonuclease signature motif containing protein [Rhodococcus sp. (in: high G+C Gram-positive bacteria)]